MNFDKNITLTEFPLHRVEQINWIAAVILSALAFVSFPFFMAKSVFIGGLIANISYLFLKKDLQNFLQGKLLHSGKTRLAKLQFFLKYYARLAAIAAVLYILIKGQICHPIGLLVGLSSVVLSILITVTSVMRRFQTTAKGV